MHIAVDGVGNRSGGGLSVLLRTVQGLLRDGRVRRLTVFAAPPRSLPIDVPVDSRLKWVGREAETKRLSKRWSWYRKGLSVAAQGVGADVVLSMNGMGWTRAPRVAFVQQAFCFAGDLRTVRPVSFQLRQIAVRFATRAALRRAEAVVVQSTWMEGKARGVMRQHCDVHTLPLGLPRTRELGSGGSPQVVTVTNGLPYKRVDNAAAIVAQAAMFGSPLRHRVVRGGLSQEELLALLGGAVALLVTSEIESFGLPIMEAFAVGCPVVAVDYAWARSVAADGALYFAPDDIVAAGGIVHRLKQDASFRVDAAKRGRERLAMIWSEDPYRRLVDLIEAQRRV